jgi:hypothetical protein
MKQFSNPTPVFENLSLDFENSLKIGICKLKIILSYIYKLFPRSHIYLR